MGQQEVIDFLKECEEPQTRKQIADALDCNPERVSAILNVLLKWKEIKFIEYDRYEAPKIVGYILRRRTRFYFVEDEE